MFLKNSLLRFGSLLGTIAVFCLTANAQAQSNGINNPIDERTGPNAKQSFPEFPETVEFPKSQSKTKAMLNVSGTVNIAELKIEGDKDFSAQALKDAQPISDELSSLHIELTSAEQLDAEWIRRQFIINDLFNKQIPLDQIVSLVQLINRSFIANGYINSGVLINGEPPKDGGTLNLRLIAGKITDGIDGLPGLSINWGPEGRNRLSKDFVANRMPSARQSPLNAIVIEREFRLLAENPAIQTVNADLRPGLNPGEAQLGLTVYPQPLIDLYISTANSRSPSIGGERYSIGGAFRNAISPGDFLSAEAGRTGGKYDFIAGYETPFIGPRTFLNARGGFNNAAVIDPQLLALNISASDWHVEGGISQILRQRPLSPGRDGEGWRAARTIKAGLTLAHRQSITNLFGRRFSFTPGAVNGRTEYTALRLNADFIQRGIKTVVAVSLTGTQGLDGTGVNIPGLVRPDRGFRTIRGQISYARRLNDKGLELRARLAGQWSDGILYSGERFSAGGLQTVRGYRETLVLSDAGTAGSLELAQSFSLSGNNAGRSSFDLGRFAVSAFFDGALLKNREGTPANPNKIASVGASLTWNPSPAIRAQFTYAHALKDIPIPGTRDLQDHGFHFLVTIRPLEFLNH